MSDKTPESEEAPASEEAPVRKEAPVSKETVRKETVRKELSQRDAEESEEDVDSEEGPEHDKPMTFWEHLDELRKRLTRAVLAVFVGTMVSWNYREDILEFFVKPFADSWRTNNLPGDPSLHFASPSDAFLAYFNLSLIGGVALATPFIFFQVWGFIAPGLYSKEKRYVIPFIISSTTLFLGGAYTGYRLAFAVTFDYLLGLSGPVGGTGVTATINVVPTVMMADYISFVMQILLGFGVMFLTPIVFSFLARVGVVTHRKLIRWMRYFIFGIFLLAAALTPPDWAGQLVMATPGVLLYFLSIGLVYIFQRKDVVEEEIAEEKRLAEEKAEEERSAAKEKADKEKADRQRAKERAAAKT